MKLNINKDGAKIKLNVPYGGTVTASAGNSKLNGHLVYLHIFFHLNWSTKSK